MRVPSLDVTVPGRAAGLTAASSIAEPWKQSVQQAVRAKWPGSYLAEECAIRLTFRLEPARFRDTALFNLLKATIDGLSNVLFASSPGRNPSSWHREDWWITELHAAKQTVTTETPSVRIEVGPVRDAFARSTAETLAHALVPGEPPLWPGDRAGAERVREWQALLQQRLQRPSSITSKTLLGVDFRFAISPQRMLISDLDNFCVPVAQAVCYVLFGDFRHPQNITELHATKALAPSSGELGTRVRVWSTGNLA